MSTIHSSDINIFLTLADFPKYMQENIVHMVCEEDLTFTDSARFAIHTEFDFNHNESEEK